MIPLALVALVFAGCGSSSSSNSSAAGGPQGGGGQGGPFAAARDPKVAACLKKQGVTLPQRPQGQRPPNGTSTAPAPGTRPTRPPGGNPAFAQRFEKMRAALEKCGVKLPARGQGGPPGGGPPPGATGTTPGETQN